MQTCGVLCHLADNSLPPLPLPSLSHSPLHSTVMIHLDIEVLQAQVPSEEKKDLLDGRFFRPFESQLVSVSVCLSEITQGNGFCGTEPVTIIK